MPFLPDTVSALAAGVLVAIAFGSAALTAAFGLGGGLVLLAAMGALLPPAAVIPVHGVAQFGANASRFALIGRHAAPTILVPFLVGSAVGVALGARVAIALPPGLVRAGVGLFILASIWLPRPAAFAPGRATYAVGGAATSFLTMFFGATGPFVAALIAAAGLGRLAQSATHAAAMVAQHGLKTAAFALSGVAYGPWLGLIALILTAGFAGSWAGARLLKGMGEPTFQRAFKLLLSAVAAFLAVAGVLEAASAPA
ncbi:MAG: TSUP family transporter [Parvularculaceae bacterium]